MRTPFLYALALSTALATPAHAQYAAPTFQASPADELASVLKRLAASPNDLYALISAGELSVKLDDMSAAAAFFARADKIDPRNGRVKAGMGAILVRAERPGEALRYFQMAEGFGLPVSRFASDRGLAHDLLGEQDRAQRDYRLALATGRDDETVRRYALSLGIVGRQAQALEQLDPLNRKQDRAAWRARAFVLAMNGDVPGASRIATTMMPGVGTGLLPFFQRLPTLGATDRAFAVHFGELRPTAARLADARLKPALPVLGPDPFAPPVRVASAPAPVPATATDRRGRRSRSRERARDRGVALASNERRAGTLVRNQAAAAPVARTTAPTPSVSVASRPAPQPGFTASPSSVAASVIRTSPAQTVAASRPVAAAPVQTAVPPTTRPVAAVPPTTQASSSIALPAARPAGTPPVQVAAAPPATAPVQAAAAPAAAAPIQVAAGPTTTAPASVAPITSAPTPVQTAAVGGPAAPLTPIATAPTASVTGTPAAVLASVAPARPSAPVAGPPNEPVTLAALPTETPAANAAPGFSSLTTPSTPAAISVDVAASTPTPVARSEESILARIVASISIPGEELGVTGPERPVPAPATVQAATTPAPTPPPQQVAAAKAKAARDEADRAAAARTIAQRATAAERESGKASGRKGRVELAARGPERKSPGARGAKVADEEEAEAKPRTAAERREAARKKVADEKTATAKKNVAKEQPEAERIWVQVAGGANESDLPKAWAAAQKKAAALKGREAYATPLRATNRVVTGPFKTQAEARAFINQLAKQGVSAFPFTSAKGQKLSKLPAK